MRGEDFSVTESDGLDGTRRGIFSVDRVDERVDVYVEDVDFVTGGGVEEVVVEGEGGDVAGAGFEGGEEVVVRERGERKGLVGGEFL